MAAAASDDGDGEYKKGLRFRVELAVAEVARVAAMAMQGGSIHGGLVEGRRKVEGVVGCMAMQGGSIHGGLVGAV